MQEAETGISNNERACLSGGLANHLAYVQHRDFSKGQVLGQISRPSQILSRCWATCCLKAVISIAQQRWKASPNADRGSSVQLAASSHGGSDDKCARS